jgi:hypothetical protein
VRATTAEAQVREYADLWHPFRVILRAAQDHQ